MRNFLVFLLLLGAGLLLLYWLDRRSIEPLPPEPEPVPVVAPEPGPQEQGLRVGGPSRLAVYDEETGRLLYRAESEDTTSEDGRDVLSNVTIELFDPEQDDVLQVRLTAARALLERKSGAELQLERRMQLEGVRADVVAGIELAPLVFETGAATIDVTDPLARRVSGDGEFTATSDELLVSGRGFDWELDAYDLRIRRAGRVELPRPGEAAATLEASGDGPLRVYRAEGPDGPLTLEANEGAVLLHGTEDPGRLVARRVALSAREGAPAPAAPGAAPGQTAAEPLALERLEAEGDVDWTSGEARFTGDRLAARFERSGRLEWARLDGEPRAELPFELSGGVLRDVPVGEPDLVVLEGQDALEIEREGDGYALHMESLPSEPGAATPARVPTISTRDFRLQSAGRIDGWRSEDQKRARFDASGGVVVRSGESTLETARFEIEIEPDASGKAVLVGKASGGARLDGTLPPERDEATGELLPAREFTLTSPEGLTIERSARGWRVRDGTRVEVSLAEPGGFRARADRVSDFVVPQSGSGEFAREGLRFHASGAVEVELEGGRFGGEELEVVSLAPVPHFVLRGTRESKAFLVSELYGEASALEIERTGDTLHARGEVTGSADFPGEEDGPVHVTFSGDELTIDRSESAELLPGEKLRTVRAEVRGNVGGSVTGGGETLVVRSERFSAERRTRLVDGAEPVELGALFIGEGAVHADFLAEESELSVDCERVEVERTARDVARGFRQLVASGDVRFQGSFGDDLPREIGGQGEILVFDSDRRGSLEAEPHGRVTLHGVEREGSAPYRLTAERIDFELDEAESLKLLALRPEIRTLGVRARGEHLTADDETGVVLSGGVRLSGATSSNVPFTLEAEEAVLVGRRDPERGKEQIEDQLEALLARGAVDFRLADGLRARGERLSVKRSTGLLRLEGAPATFDLGLTRLETEWVEFDPVLEILVGTGRGRMLVQEEALGAVAPNDQWALEFLSASTLLELDSVVLVIQEPLFHAAQFQTALRASWGIFWLNREAFEDAAKRDDVIASLKESLATLKVVQERGDLSDVLALFRSAKLAGLLQEVYFEGPVEVLSEGELLARSDAIYLDTASQHGWLARATLNLGGQFLGQRQEKLIVKADWLRLSSDANLRADHATVTSCTFDDPHVKVVTGDLRIEPAEDASGEASWRLMLEDNRIELYDKLRIPLPTIDVATDEEFQPLWPTLSLANSARFGTLFSFAFTRPADKIGRLFDKVARSGGEEESKPPTAAAPEGGAPGQPESGVAEPGGQAPSGGDAVSGGAEPGGPRPGRKRSDVDAHYKIDGSYLGSRGGLLDLGLEIEAEPEYWFDLWVGLAYDTGEDKGYIRVPEDERDTLRRWIRSQAYFDHGKNDWSFALSDQSDAGVQSEFFESQFLRYERAENYAQWRRSSDENFVQGSVELRTDDFRSEIEELPSLTGYRGRSPIARFGNVSLIHTGDARAEYLRRREGTEPSSPFGPPPTFSDVDQDDFGVPDGLGEREVLRADTTQALELPVPLGAGWRLTPFVSGRASAWSEGADEDDQPSRLIAEGGARLGASFWKRAGSRLHQVAPFVEYRAELEREDDEGLPVFYDPIDRVLSGDFVRGGARTRLWASGDRAILDLDLIGTYASDRSDGASDGWLPIEVFARTLLDPYGHEFELFHDGRYDVDTSETVYSLFSVGTHFGEEWGVQLSHQRGRDADGVALFEAASASGLYRWTEKWEFEARQSFSLLEDEELDTRLVLRRYGHDIVLEVETSYREGEGSSFGISVEPRFGYRPPRVGYVPW